ncbi:MAG: GNAT family N-acetyltransferase [Methanocalculus sp. MSAO_Arc2]|nr:MAG: GNAT family N-acetyltransferase [Methanocalculus sp. MSAO_Arc2]
MNPGEVLLLTEGERDPDIPLHTPQTNFSTQDSTGDPVDAIIRAASIVNPTLIIIPRHISSIDREKIHATGVPLFLPHPGGEATEIRELRSEEFHDANRVWFDYHETTGDPLTDRVFAALEGGEIVSLARCRKHPDGFEVDAVWTPKQHRGRGLARLVTGALVEACYNEELTMYSVQHLEKFYGEFGFVPIPERELPASVRARYLWAAGNLEGAEVLPMKRIPSRPPILTQVDTHK